MTDAEQFAAGLPDGPLWVSGKMLKQLVTLLMQDRAVLGQGCGHEVPTASGRQLFPQSSESGDAPAYSAFDVVKSGAGEIRVLPGVIAGGETELVPSGFSPGDDPPFTLSASGTGYVYIPVTMHFDDSYNLWTVTAAGSPETGSSIPSETASTYYLALGSYSTAGDGTLSVSSYQRGPGTVTRSGTSTNFVSAFYA